MKGTIAIILYAVVALFAITSGQKEEALIDTGDEGDAALGKIQGSYAWVMEGLNQTGRKYYWFTGIPYANTESYVSTAGRFKPSKVYDKGPLQWDGGVFIANESKAMIWCLQKELIDIGVAEVEDVTKLDPFYLIKSYYSRSGIQRRRDSRVKSMGQEDCLTVTISTPQLPRGESMDLLPVIYFIHGGGFDAFWGSVFGGQRLLKHDVVLVTINYRMGVFGSLNLGIEDAPGNQAVTDCITGLKWVQRYIHHFGGDKNRVTVSGQSAGAVLATTVFLSPAAKGLFHGAIGDSGSAYSVWANQKNPIRENLKVISHTQCKDKIPPNGDGELDDDQAQALYECMMTRPIDELLNARDGYGADEAKEARLGYDAFVPSVQKASLSQAVLTSTPMEIVKNGEQSDVPLMMGATRHDGTFVALTTFYDYMVAQGKDSDAAFVKNDVIPTFLKGVGLEDPSGALTHSLVKTYLGDTANSDDIISKLPGLVDIHSVLGFKAGGYGLVEGHAKLNPNSYYYAFDYKGMFTTYGIANGENVIPGGIAHVDDLLYLFQLIPLLSEKDWAVSDRYVKYWANFATYGNPNGPGNLDEPFPKYSPVDHRFLIINETDSIGLHCRDSWIGNANELV